jgi:hypothetical protein
VKNYLHSLACVDECKDTVYYDKCQKEKINTENWVDETQHGVKLKILY